MFIGLLFAIYGNFFGDYDYKGFAYNFGRGLMWPTIIFPALGKFIGGVLIVGVIGYFALFAKR